MPLLSTCAGSDARRSVQRTLFARHQHRFVAQVGGSTCSKTSLNVAYPAMLIATFVTRSAIEPRSDARQFIGVVRK